MNKFKAWQRQLLLAVGQGLQGYGFSELPKGQSFLRNHPWGRAAFHLAFIKHDNDFDVTADVAIRFRQVEELIAPHKDTYTLGCELGNLSEGRQRRWTVASAEDVPPVAGSVLNAFVEIAVPYFEEFSVPQRALEVLSGDGRDSRLHSPIRGERAQQAVAMALHLNGMEDAKRLARLKLALLEEYKDFGLPEFREFLERIGLNSGNGSL